MSYTSKLNLCLSLSTSLGGSDVSASKVLPTNRLNSRLNFALAGYGLLSGGASSASGPAVISTTAAKSTNITMTDSKTTTITTELLGG